MPKSLKPFFYDISTVAIFDTFTEPNTFDGHVTIKFTCLEITNSIVFHKVDLNFHLVKVEFEQTPLSIISSSYDDVTQLYNVTLSQSLNINQNYSISINYTGNVQVDNFGYFKTFYIDDNGKKKWLLASQFEPVDARRAFPCFDEPNMKAQFKITVFHHKDHKAISNMPVYSSVTK